MEEIQAAIERMNALDYVDEAELEKLEAEIEARLLALEEDNARRAAESEDEEVHFVRERSFCRFIQMLGFCFFFLGFRQSVVGVHPSFRTFCIQEIQDLHIESST